MISHSYLCVGIELAFSVRYNCAGTANNAANIAVNGVSPNSVWQADAIEPRIGYADSVYNDTKFNKKYENVSMGIQSNLSKWSPVLSSHLA